VLERHLREAELGVLFALSWPLTWFSHAIDSYATVVKCFDLFIASDLLMPVYVTASLLLARQREILSSEKDMPTLHHLLSSIPASLDFEDVLEAAADLYKEFPARALKSKYLPEYDAMCRESAHRVRFREPPPANTLSRTRWLVVATGGAVLAGACYMLQQYMQLQ